MRITAGNVSVGKGAQRNESTPFPMNAHSLPYGGFDAHFPLHCTTRQTSLSSVCCIRLATFTAQSKMTFRYLEPDILEWCFVEKEAIQEFTMLEMLYFLPEYCQTSHSLLYGTAVLCAVLIAAVNTCLVYSLKEPQNQGVCHNSRI